MDIAVNGSRRNSDISDFSHCRGTVSERGDRKQRTVYSRGYREKGNLNDFGFLPRTPPSPPPPLKMRLSQCSHSFNSIPRRWRNTRNNNNMFTRNSCTPKVRIAENLWRRRVETAVEMYEDKTREAKTQNDASTAAQSCDYSYVQCMCVDLFSSCTPGRFSKI